MGRGISAKDLEAEIARLRGLDLPNLRAEWEQHYQAAVPRTLRRDILIRSIIWQMQAKVLGGLKPETRKYLRQVAEAARSGTSARPVSRTRIKPGTKLIRVWQDQTHTVTALENGFEWKGKCYQSLSKIARTITGTRWNGLVFFGVKQKASETTLAIKSRKTASSEMAHA